MATPPSPKPAAPVALAKAPPAASAPSSDNMAAESTNFPPLYEAAILYSADCYDAAQEVLKTYLKTTEGKNSLRTWLMLFDFYQLTNNQKEFDALSMLFTVKFERSPPLWLNTEDSSDPRRREKRENKDFFKVAPASDGSLMAVIPQLEAFAKELQSCRIDFAAVKQISDEEAGLLAGCFQKLRRAKIPLWFNSFDPFVGLIKHAINDKPASSRGLHFWALLFELYILEGKTEEYEELGLQYAVAFEMSPPAWETVMRPNAVKSDAAGGSGASSEPQEQAGFPIKGVFSLASKEILQQLSINAATKSAVVVDMSELLRIDFSAVNLFYEAIRAIHLSQKRVILSNVNELVAALLEIFAISKHAILMRKKAA